MSQFTKMLEPSPPKNYEQTELGRSILSPVAFPAKMYRAPALEKALRIAMGKLLGQGCGESTQESLANLDQSGLWQKMCEGCCQQVLISDREETSELFWQTWPTWGTMRFGRVMALKTLERPIKEKECSLWRTPQAHNGQQGPKSKELYEKCLQTGQSMITLTDQVKNCNWPTPTVSDIFTGSLKSSQQKPGSMHSVNLSQCVNWPTPITQDAKRGSISAAQEGKGLLTNKVLENERNWPTPRAREGNSGEYGCKSCERNANKFYLDGVVKQEEKIKGQLNADWVELLMGLPIGWTDIDKPNEELNEWPGWPAPMGATQNWATPNCMDMLPSRSFEAMKHQAINGARKNRKLPGNLREQIDPLMRKAYIEASQENGGCLDGEITVSGQYPYEPPRVVVGQKNRAKRLKCLGNGCVPMQIYPIFKAIVEMESKEEALR